MKQLLAVAILVFTIVVPVLALEVPKPPADAVLDQANILSPEAEKQIVDLLAAEEAKSGNELAVLTIKSLEGEVLEQYALKVGRSWGVGQKENDNGILLLVSADDRQIRIEVGRGLEGALPDITAKNIIDYRIVPQFRRGDYDAGVIDGITAISQAINGEYTLGDVNTNEDFENASVESAIFVLFFVLQWLAAILGRSKRIWPGAILGAFLGMLILYVVNVAAGVVAIALLSIFGLIFDSIVSKNYQTRKNSGSKPSWWAGGGGFGGGRSGGGFGGGSFGGGGSSGKW